MKKIKLSKLEEIVLLLHSMSRDDSPVKIFCDCDGFCITQKVNCIRVYGHEPNNITEILFN